MNLMLKGTTRRSGRVGTIMAVHGGVNAERQLRRLQHFADLGRLHRGFQVNLMPKGFTWRSGWVGTIMVVGAQWPPPTINVAPLPQWAGGYDTLRIHGAVGRGLRYITHSWRSGRGRYHALMRGYDSDTGAHSSPSFTFCLSISWFLIFVNFVIKIPHWQMGTSLSSQRA